ncbi:L-rhamnose mutarotase [Microlunatus elymi]|uniref:L-rhamnose mutarotase n=1 Tax=Microlunatus elymi TaxID=2596828 RepID=A0A516PYG9_9ACTN|nr:L-rhamnose mutarotase [Microlunatus elymi]QDP96021.1 L-rhamnose mutarotase [Microlunatus elymi]
MRVALHSILKPETEDRYRTDHAAIPDDLVASFDRLGIVDWTIWRSGRDLFHLVDCEDFDAAWTALADDPANRRWQAFIGPLVEGFRTDNEGSTGLELERIWSLAGQSHAHTRA